MNFEFWLGNENLHQLTTQRQYMMRIDMISKSGESLYATYSNFMIDGEVENYRLTSLGKFKGTSGLVDAMSCHESMNFSAKDNDHDRTEKNCASTTFSGWWFNGGTDREDCPQNYCKHANLNGVYGTSSTTYGILWSGERDLQFTEMKIRPYNTNTVTFM
ncbi:Tenascin-X [Holothuria leucospilota]|uniref:Tenascin-X n=1 Tax=Holothuria leucospilota TaxID=206669 RepID=A0A9Q1BVD0_HOLLE|nr:Tenascin-X [Holothuria leucospilota]